MSVFGFSLFPHWMKPFPTWPLCSAFKSNFLGPLGRPSSWAFRHLTFWWNAITPSPAVSCLSIVVDVLGTLAGPQVIKHLIPTMPEVNLRWNPSKDFTVFARSRLSKKRYEIRPSLAFQCLSFGFIDVCIRDVFGGYVFGCSWPTLEQKLGQCFFNLHSIDFYPVPYRGQLEYIS